jgi:hypothetical protein
MSLPALPVTADTRSITERVNVLIRDFNAGRLDDARTLQLVSMQTGAVATGIKTVPIDDTIPQNNEGDEYMSLSITPRSPLSRLIIEVSAHVAHSVGVVGMVMSLFQDDLPSALRSTFGVAGVSAGGQPFALSLRHVMAAGASNPTTFKTRIGSPNAGTTTFNGLGGARFLGGVLASGMMIREVLP